MAEVRLRAWSDRFDEGDDRWQQQVLLLRGALAQVAGPAEHRLEPVPGTKGGLGDVVFHLTGPGVVAGVVTALAAWLRRDRGRSVRVTWTVDGQHGEFTVTTETSDNATLRSALEHGLRAAVGDSAAGDEPDDRNGEPDDRNGAADG